MDKKRYSVENLRKELRKSADKVQAKNLQRFFKTAPGDYAQGDIFLGIKVPVQRRIIKSYIDLDFRDLALLLESAIHEERFCALQILRKKYEKALPGERKKIFDFYMRYADRVNNWDLVDLSAPNIVGEYLMDKDRKILYDFAKSKNIWKRRIAILSTFTFIKNDDFEDCLRISEMMLQDKHDLIHKAVGWMLREIGKRDMQAEEKFLKKHYKMMPRTMLCYSLEKFSEEKRRYYMGKDKVIR